ncbi:hypothetical protein HHK36_007351 [Tetracentron sinense]|uniref:Protein RIK n=1 Tax=Tetracentron sinense TaxID=13715 RepID=A0A834ZKU9_TETSI|nr:hypothetical protein HHK36_007351 [Tetracentron sinense]
MTEDSSTKVSEETMATAAAASARQRRKRKWDQPAESLVPAGLALPGVLPLGNMGSLVGITLPGVATLSGALLTSPLPATCATVPLVFQAPPIQHHTAAVVQKLNQPKIQDELIAREIVINDAESTIRYKLTKRQTQEEIQKCTGAVVITRGKYRPPNALPDNEKPLYLHISAGSHLKETGERIKAVDHAAAMVEEMLKQSQNSLTASTSFNSLVNNGGQVTQPLSTCVFLGFDTDPSFNIAARIRGPNDQYINHIMNETGATVLLRGQGSGNLGSPNVEEIQQPLHLYLSSNNPKSLEDAKRLAENLLDTISAECGASRISSCKVYNAVPPPQQLLSGVQSSGDVLKVNAGYVAGLTSSSGGSTPAPPVSLATVPSVSSVFPQGTGVQAGGLFNHGHPQPNMVSCPQPSVAGGTSYSGYGGIFPQATPLQQVALALRQSSSPITSTSSSVASVGKAVPKASLCSYPEKVKQPPQKRKFQELPVASKGPAKPLQVFSLTFYEADRLILGSVYWTLGEFSEDSGMRSISTMPAPKKLINPSSSGMPPPKNMLPPPPPPKFASPAPVSQANGNNSILIKSKSVPVPENGKKSPSLPIQWVLRILLVWVQTGRRAASQNDTLIKLMEYGDDDDDPEGTDECPTSKSNVTPKPFWAL